MRRQEDPRISKFFRSFDEPMMLFLVEADEAIMGIVVFFGLMIGTMIAGIVVGGLSFFYLAISVLVAFYYGKYKRSKPNGYTFQLLYKLGYFHPTDIPKGKKYFSSKNEFKVIPSHITKELKGQ